VGLTLEDVVESDEVGLGDIAEDVEGAVDEVVPGVVGVEDMAEDRVVADDVTVALGGGMEPFATALKVAKSAAEGLMAKTIPR